MSIHRYYTLTLSEKLLYTSVLLLIGLGYLMATAYLYVTHEGLDGKSGLSVTDVADSYYGNRSGTRLEAMIRGPMAGYISEDDRGMMVRTRHQTHIEKDLFELSRREFRHESARLQHL
jgi:hypothetical protein